MSTQNSKQTNAQVQATIARLNEARRKKNEHKIIWAKVHGVEFKLNNNVSVKFFNGVDEVIVNQPLNEKAYFNSAWFKKQGIKVIVESKKKSA